MISIIYLFLTVRLFCIMRWDYYHCRPFTWGTPPAIIFTLIILIGGLFAIWFYKCNKQKRCKIAINGNWDIIIGIIGLFAVLINYSSSLDSIKSQLLVSLIGARKIEYKGEVIINNKGNYDISLSPIDTGDIDLFDGGYYNYNRFGCIIKEKIPFKTHLNELDAEMKNRLESETKDINCGYRRGNIFFTAKQYYFAIKEYEPEVQKLLLLIPSYQSQDQFKKYLTEYASALYLNLGLAYYNLGIEQKAIETLSKSITYKPIYAAADSNLAVLYAKRGQFDEAKKVIEAGFADDENQGRAHDGNREKAKKQIEDMRRKAIFYNVKSSLKKIFSNLYNWVHSVLTSLINKLANYRSEY